MQWLWKQWANVLRVRDSGVPTVGFTWYSLTDQVDWDTTLRNYNGNVNALGLYDLDRNIRPVGRAYKQLIRGCRIMLLSLEQGRQDRYSSATRGLPAVDRESAWVKLEGL